MFLQPCCKISEKLQHVKKGLEKNLHHSQSVPLHLKPLCPSKSVSASFQRAWRAQTEETCSSMWLFYFLYCVASWLQMADVCSGLTEPAVGVGQTLTRPAASVGATAPHSYRRWRVRWSDGLMSGTPCIVSNKRDELFVNLLLNKC